MLRLIIIFFCVLISDSFSSPDFSFGHHSFFQCDTNDLVATEKYIDTLINDRERTLDNWINLSPSETGPSQRDYNRIYNEQRILVENKLYCLYHLYLPTLSDNKKSEFKTDFDMWEKITNFYLDKINDKYASVSFGTTAISWEYIKRANSMINKIHNELKSEPLNINLSRYK